MPPSPGRIHSLPVKVLYTIDTSPQSFFTVLPERQQVYVHPPSTSDLDHGPMSAGSCTLKAIGRGICFASPECIPNASTLDFSVYSLDPAGSRSTSRAFTPSLSDQSASSSSWTGRGFLSWALSEVGQGQTLIRGRLVREYEFASSHFASEGGLEGLMAAAAASSRNGNKEDQDGKGWGLEVSISLRQLNPEGKLEFQGRKEFEDMLVNGKTLSVPATATATASGSGSGIGGTSPAAGTPLNSIQRSSPHPSRGGALTPISNNNNNQQSQAGPSSAATVRPTIAQPSPIPFSRPSSSMSQRPSFSSTLPPSSLPPGPSSSASNLASSRPSSAADSRHTQIKPEPVPTPESRSPSLREITPPPLPRPKSPPPSTPSRARLHALLRADGAMSPGLARSLASNPVLRSLLKAVPQHSNALAALRNITGINNPHPPADPKGKQREITNGDKEGSGSPEQATTPTPLPNTNVRSPVNPNEGCCNCGTMQSNCWRTKKMKDGTPRKVCDDCGLYFNKHKRMRPPELWNRPPTTDYTKGTSTTTTGAGAGDNKRKASHMDNHNHGPNLDGSAGGVRSSPRLNRTNSDTTTHTLQSQNLPAVPESPRKRQKSNKAVPQPSPRMATRASAKAGGDFSAEAFGFSPNTIFGTSPPDALQIPSVGQTQSIDSVIAGMSMNHTPNSTIPGAAVGLLSSNDMNGGGGGAGDEFDISALLASMEAAAGGINGSGNGEGFDINSLFTGFDLPDHSNTTTNAQSTGTGTGTGEGGGNVELSQEMMDLLAGWEGQLVAGLGLGMGMDDNHGHSTTGTGTGTNGRST